MPHVHAAWYPSATIEIVPVAVAEQPEGLHRLTSFGGSSPDTLILVASSLSEPSGEMTDAASSLARIIGDAARYP